MFSDVSAILFLIGLGFAAGFTVRHIVSVRRRERERQRHSWTPSA
jgi:hypothetical protein